MAVLSDFRAEHALTQEEVVARTGIAYNTYRRYEYGESFPSPKAICSLAGVYDMASGELFELLCREKGYLSLSEGVKRLSEDGVESLLEDIEQDVDNDIKNELIRIMRRYISLYRKKPGEGADPKGYEEIDREQNTLLSRLTQWIDLEPEDLDVIITTRSFSFDQKVAFILGHRREFPNDSKQADLV